MESITVIIQREAATVGVAGLEMEEKVPWKIY